MTTPKVDAPADVKVKQESDDDSDFKEKDAEGQEDEEYSNDEETRQLKKKRLYDKKRRKKLSEEQRAKRAEYARKRRANASDEMRAKERERSRNRKRRAAELRAKGLLPPAKPRAPTRETPEQREKRLEARKRRLAGMTEEQRKEYRLGRYFERKAREENMPKEKREAELKKMAEYFKNYMKNLPPEKKEQYKVKQRERLKKQQNNMWKENPEKMLKYCRDKVAKETPEQRQVRLRRYKIYGERRKLKKQLENEGVHSMEDIEKRCEELVEKMKSEPLPPLSSEYKPRPSGRKPKKMSVKPPGRKPQNVAAGIPRNNWNRRKASSEYTYTPMPSRRRLKNWGILYEVEMQGKTAQENCQSGSTPVEITEKHKSISPRQQQNKLDHLATSTENVKVEAASNFDDCPSSPVGDDHFCPSDDENLPPLHCCPHCLVTFQNESELSCHIGTEHPWKCPHCSERVSSSSQLASHFNTKHSKDQFVCMRCPWRIGNSSKNSSFKTQKELLHHVQRHHASSYWPCPACNLLLYSEPRFYSHFAACTVALALKQAGKNTLVCDICGKSFATRKGYADHMNQYHHPDSDKLVCPRCQRCCSHPKAFWLHFVTCSKLVPKQPRPNNKDDQRQPQPPNLFLSEKKEKQERRKWDRKQAEPIPCDQCGKTFAQKCTLDDHIRRDHQGESYMCPQCGKNFQSAGKLWRHQAEIHGLTDLPPPPGVEVMRCLYCQEFIMRGYEFHVKKKHPEHLQTFRANELPKVKEKLKQVQIVNPKRSYSNPEHGLVRCKKIRIRSRLNEARKVNCPVCQLVMSRGHLPRHMKTIHPNVGQQDKSIECSSCDKICANAKLFRCHYATNHAIDGLDEKIGAKNLITKRRSKCSRKMEAVCSICDVVLWNYKLAIRVHFLARHYSQFLEIIESADVGLSAP